MLLFVVALTLFTSCKKDEVTYGNSDLTTSNTVALNNWSADYDDGINFGFVGVLSWGEITQSVIDNGVVLVYLKGNGGSWYSIPYSLTSNDYSYNFSYSFEVGKVSIYCDGFDNNGSPNPSDFNGNEYKIVVIDKHQIQANPNIDLTNYEDVSNAFKL